MVTFRNSTRVFATLFALSLIVASLTSCGRKKYENPITKDTQQPDKVLFDRAVKDIEHGRFEVARLTLNTLINTYDTSEFLAKAKLAVADSWYREGGAHGLAQAEAEYKDFILFYPQMEEAAESQWRVCQIHYRQMEKADRDNTQALRAEDECRIVLTQFPNSRYVPQATQYLRNVQEALAEKEFRTGNFYHSRAAYPAAANRLSYVVDQYPLYSGADEALWQLGDSYDKLGDRWEDKSAQAYSRIVKDYPLSNHADEAKKKLQRMNRPVPAADPVALARMQYEREHVIKSTTLGKVMAPVNAMISRGPDPKMAAKMGAPSMETLRPPTPISVPSVGPTPGTAGGEVTATVNGNSDIDSKPDARTGAAGQTAAGAAGAAGATAGATDAKPEAKAAAQQGPLPTNYQIKGKKVKTPKEKKPKKGKTPPPATPATDASKTATDGTKSATDAAAPASGTTTPAAK